MRTLLLTAMLLCPLLSKAALVVTVNEPKRVGQKAVIKLTMKNTFTEKIESARAVVFLLDDQGRMVGQSTKWVIGGTKDKPALAPDHETTFNFVAPMNKPFTQTKVTFSRVVLEDGKLANVTQGVSVSPAAK